MTPGLWKLLTDASSDGGSAARLISLNPTLRAEVEEKAGLIMDRSAPADPKMLALVLRQHARILAVPDQSDESWADMFGVYLDMLGPLPIESVSRAFERWHRGELYPKDPGRHAFFPKPAEVYSLAEPLMLELKMAAYRARKALEHVEAHRPREKTPEDAETIRQMLSEFRGSAKAMPGDPRRPLESPQQVAQRLREAADIPVGPSGLSALMRDRIGLPPEPIGQGVSTDAEDDPGVVL